MKAYVTLMVVLTATLSEVNITLEITDYCCASTDYEDDMLRRYGPNNVSRDCWTRIQRHTADAAADWLRRIRL